MLANTQIKVEAKEEKNTNSFENFHETALLLFLVCYTSQLS